ncbi:uncharacterized protein LOC120887223 [Ictidomys tridecemlineatus]
MRPPRCRRPRPSAPAALPPLPPILCLLSRSWHLSQRARFPAHPFAAGSGRGRGYEGPGEEGTEEAMRLRAPQPEEIARGWLPCPHTRAPLLRGQVRAADASGIPTRRLRPPQCPLRVRNGSRPSRAPPNLGPARSGPGGRQEQRIRRSGPAPRPAAPRARPRGHAAPGAARPRPAPPARPRPSRGAAPRGPTSLSLRDLGPARPRRVGRLKLPARPAPTSLAPKRLPGRARRLRSKAPAAMIAGSGTRAHARARLRDPPRTDSRGLPAALCALRAARGSPGLFPWDQCVSWSSRPGTRTVLVADSGSGFPQGKSRARAPSSLFPDTTGPAEQGARYPLGCGGADPASGSGRTAHYAGDGAETAGRSSRPQLCSQPDGDTAASRPHGSFLGSFRGRGTPGLHGLDTG